MPSSLGITILDIPHLLTWTNDTVTKAWANRVTTSQLAQGTATSWNSVRTTPEE